MTVTEQNPIRLVCCFGYFGVFFSCDCCRLLITYIYLFNLYMLYLQLDTQVVGHSRHLGPLERSRFLTTSEAAAGVVPSPVTEELRLLLRTGKSWRGVSEAKRSYVFISRSSKFLILSILLFPKQCG